MPRSMPNQEICETLLLTSVVRHFRLEFPADMPHDIQVRSHIALGQAGAKQSGHEKGDVFEKLHFARILGAFSGVEFALRFFTNEYCHAPLD